MKRSIVLAPLVLVAAAAGCTTSQVGVPPASHPSNIAADALQLAVGTATIAQNDGTPFVGLNVVTTFRQPSGEPATVSNTPTLSGPADFSAGAKTKQPHVIYGLTPQQVLAAAQTYTSTKLLGAYANLVAGSFFASVVGAFGYGLAPLNIVAQSPNLTLFAGPANPLGSCVGVVHLSDIPTAGSFTGSQPAFNAVRYIELDLPVFANQCPNGSAGGGASVTPFKYYGGPPAWPSPQGFGIPNGFPGYPLGFTDFVTPAVSGTYTLSVAYPTNGDATQYGATAASATLPASRVSNPLPLFAPPTLRIQADGSAFVDVTVPAHVTEAIVLTSTTRCDFGLPQSQTLPDQHYAIVTHQSGFQSLFLSSNLGPPDASGNRLHTFCTSADTQKYGTASASYSLAAAGFDYPAYEASYPQSATMRPAIASAAGQADVTTAIPVVNRSYPLQ